MEDLRLEECYLLELIPLLETEEEREEKARCPGTGFIFSVPFSDLGLQGARSVDVVSRAFHVLL
jgi:hypothetical protein